ncbi:MAG TPA: MFS transporter [Acetobacteraceae bacterium]|nr:MFS transporter [Acetobacteraceae bacterium]
MTQPAAMRGVDGSYAWMRLALSLLLGTVGGLMMWAVVVALPAMQAEFGVARGSAALPYTLAMIGLATGNIFMGRLVDRVGIFPPLLIAGTSICLGYAAASQAGSLAAVAAAFFIPIAMLGSSVTFGPLMADMSHWFVRRRGLAMSICAAGNYLAGAIWPPVVEWGIAHFGWRHTLLTAGVLSAAVILPGAFALRRRTPHAALVRAADAGPGPGFAFAGLTPGAVQVLLCIAGVACCVAMAMPQVHIVAYCGDLGYGPARGAQMLSLMLAFGVVSRVTSGFVADRIGGLATLLLGSLLQLLALVLYLGFDGLVSLYVISALFGLFQGGIVPSYAIIVREYFPAREAGARIGAVLTATMLGMALGGWMSGAIFDAAGSYGPAFLNGIGWNVLNASIALLLIWRAGGGRHRTLVPA